jgi:hypothetical protein
MVKFADCPLLMATDVGLIESEKNGAMPTANPVWHFPF